MAPYPDVPVLAFGEDNMFLNRNLDKLSLARVDVAFSSRSTAFAKLNAKVGLRDVWRERHAEDKCYSCHSASHGGLSRIDLALGNFVILPNVEDSAYEPRLLSDHTPLWVHLGTVGLLIRLLWHVSQNRLTFFLRQTLFLGIGLVFAYKNAGTSSATIFWDTLIKARLWGLLIREITNVKCRTRDWEDMVRGEMQRREADLVVNPTPSTQKSWFEAQSLYNSVVLSAAEKKQYFFKQSYFKGRGRIQAICSWWWLGHNRKWSPLKLLGKYVRLTQILLLFTADLCWFIYHLYTGIKSRCLRGIFNLCTRYNSTLCWSH